MKWTTFGWWLTLAIISASCWKSSTAACVGLRNILTATSAPLHSASTTSPNAPAPILRTTRTSGHGIVRYSVVFLASASRAAVSTAYSSISATSRVPPRRRISRKTAPASPAANRPRPTAATTATSRGAAATPRMSRQQSAEQQHRSTRRQHAASRRGGPGPPPSPPASAATFGDEDEPEDAGVADVEVDAEVVNR